MKPHELDEQLFIRVFGKSKPRTPADSGYGMDKPTPWIDGWFLERDPYKLEVRAPKFSSDMILAMNELLPKLARNGLEFTLEGPLSGALPGTEGFWAYFFVLKGHRHHTESSLRINPTPGWPERVAYYIAETALLELG